MQRENKRTAQAHSKRLQTVKHHRSIMRGEKEDKELASAHK